MFRRKKRIIVSGAGSGGHNNIIRDIRAARSDVFIVGTNIDKFTLKLSNADKDYLLPPVDSTSYVKKLNALIEAERIDGLVPGGDREVSAVAENREKIRAPILLPRKETVRLCQDKYALNRHLEKCGMKIAHSSAIKDISDVYSAFKEVKKDGAMVWCRIRDSSGSMGSLPVKNAEHAKFWIEYWRDMRSVNTNRFMLCEYLPGRDYAFQSIWKDGELVIGKACERLSYFFAKNMPAGSSSTPKVARLTSNKNVIDTCIETVKFVDDNPNGIFSIDLKENREGEPCVTEINVGRFCMITPIFDLTGKYNMADIYLRLMFGEEVKIKNMVTDIDENMYLIRDLDILPTLARL
ncbi:unnamed protein product [marine sediment metagenome]|uniref:ATP-grasp domain-containing protein n=1 Tax=marine sediment metagenome TaxID=412755 RepID=X1DV83_9ZZZZ